MTPTSKPQSSAPGRVLSPLDVIYDAIVEVRDASPRLPDDADSHAVAQAVIDALNAAGYSVERWVKPGDFPEQPKHDWTGIFEGEL